MKRRTVTALFLTTALVACNAPQEREERSGLSPDLRQKEMKVEAEPIPNQPRAQPSQPAELAVSAAAHYALADATATHPLTKMRQAEGIPPRPLPVAQEESGPRFVDISESGVVQVSQHPLSTFSIDVDSGSYALVRRFLSRGQLPPKAAVRVEEMINYFDYAYPEPTGDHPFAVITEMAPTPWNENSRLLHIGIQGRGGDLETRPAANLVFLIDVSGSMSAADKLPLLKSAFRLLVQQLDGEDRVSMVVYAGASGVVLEPTAGDEQATILAALEKLQAGGSTHGSAGIQLAYEMAQKGFRQGGINRVILATDGDFNVGTVSHEQLLQLIERKRQSGISLTTLGFGEGGRGGNYHDHLMEQLADHGNGHYAYIDTLNEAQKVLVREVASTLEVIASDVKIQVEWNPAWVSSYRLIGYANRRLADEAFNNDKVDAGEIGAGHTVTALYEVTLVDSAQPAIDPLRYGRSPSQERKEDEKSHELAFVKLRYKPEFGESSRLITHRVDIATVQSQLETTTVPFRFSAAVAGFGELLRGGTHLGDWGYEQLQQLATTAYGEDRFGYRREFLRLSELAAGLEG
ncbi:MAG: VWA domain-containing protein [Gammaproteobacteria bacterium]|nr:VWA domain-containing protein [Gammaproteobacteria bacterium]